MDFKGYYFITDRQLSRNGILNDVQTAVECGVKLIQYREKEYSSRKLFEEAQSLRKICPKQTFIINDRLDIALAVKADGLHIGQEDLPLKVARKILGKRKIIGITVRNMEEAIQAVKEGADYLAPSPIFQTNTKTDAGEAVGLEFVKLLKKKFSIPIVAIGGIDYSKAKDVIEAGADMVCAISAVVTQLEIKKAILKFQELFL